MLAMVWKKGMYNLISITTFMETSCIIVSISNKKNVTIDKHVKIYYFSKTLVKDILVV